MPIQMGDNTHHVHRLNSNGELELIGTYANGGLLANSFLPNIIVPNVYANGGHLFKQNVKKKNRRVKNTSSNQPIIQPIEGITSVD
jgi:hypothetical protein